MGVEELIPAGLSYDETLERIHEAGGIAIIPHPFQKSRHGVAPHISREQLAAADAIEVYNSRLLTGIANQRAERFAKRRNLPMTAGSDAHISEMVGQAITEVGTDTRTADAILEAITEGRTSVVGSKTPWRISFQQAAGGARRRLKHALADLL
jgi:predicted metal-dependent phosphoesterase TrpH